MRFAHLADSHLGYRQYGLLERENDFYEVFDKTIDKIIESDVDFVIHSGDLFEIAKPSPEAIFGFQQSFLKLKEAKIPIYAIAGNHDSVMRKGSLPPQIIFKDFGLKLISYSSPAYIQGGVLICGMPFTPKSRKKLLLERLNELSKYADKYPKSILVSHQGIDKYLPFQYELEIGELPRNFNYYAMGHVHNYINDQFGKGRLVYPGSCEIWKANEVTDSKINGKGFCIVDITPDMPVVERVKIDLPREFIKKVIDYNKLQEKLHLLEEDIKNHKNKPILDLTIENGNFNSSDVYETVNETLGKYALTIRPTFKPDEIVAEEEFIVNDDNLNPRNLLADNLNKSFGSKEINDLSMELLDNLSKDNFEESKNITEIFYQNYYETEKNNSINANRYNNNIISNNSNKNDNKNNKNNESNETNLNHSNNNRNVSLDDF